KFHCAFKIGLVLGFRFFEELVSSFAGRVQFWLHPFDRFLDGLADELLPCLSSVSHAPAPVVSDAAYLNLGACNLKDAQKKARPSPGRGEGDGLPILDTRNPSSRHCCTGRRISHRVYRRLSELAKSRPANFFLDDSRWYH